MRSLFESKWREWRIEICTGLVILTCWYYTSQLKGQMRANSDANRKVYQDMMIELRAAITSNTTLTNRLAEDEAQARAIAIKSQDLGESIQEVRDILRKNAEQRRKK